MFKGVNLKKVFLVLTILLLLLISGCPVFPTAGMLVKSISVVNFISNAQNIEESNFIIQVILNGGADQVAGSSAVTEEELENLSGQDIENDFIIIADKLEAEFTVPIKDKFLIQTGRGDPSEFIYDIDAVYSKKSHCLLAWQNYGEMRKELVENAFNECKQATNFVGHSWEVLSDSSCGVFQTQINIGSYCWTKETEAKVTRFDLVNKKIDWEVRFTLSGKMHTSVTLTANDTQKNLPNGLGSITWTNNALSNILPPQIQAVHPAWLVKVNKWITVPTTQALYDSRLREFENTVSSWGASFVPNHIAVISKFDLLQMAKYNFLNREIGTYDLSEGQIREPHNNSALPEFQITLKAKFVGIIRNVTEPFLSCSNAQGWTIAAGQQQPINLSVRNNGTARGSIKLQVNCPPNVSFRFSPVQTQDSYDAGQTRNYTAYLSSGLAGSISNCTITAVDSVDSTIRSSPCVITGAVTTPSLCGDTIIQAGEQCDSYNLGGATCVSLGYVKGTLSCTPACQFDKSDCKYAEKCGNSVIDPGENCRNCPPDVKCAAGETCNEKGECVPEIDWFFWAVVGIILLAIVLAIPLLLKKEKKPKK